MAKVSFGTVASFDGQTHRVMEIGGVEVAVFNLDGDFVAYENHCPHMGGPVCQGKIMPKVEEHLAADKTSLGMGFSKTEKHIVCPWHGYEFNLRTGQHPGNPRYRLRKLHVQVEGGDIYVELPAYAAT